MEADQEIGVHLYGVDDRLRSWGRTKMADCSTCSRKAAWLRAAVGSNPTLCARKPGHARWRGADLAVMRGAPSEPKQPTGIDRPADAEDCGHQDVGILPVQHAVTDPPHRRRPEIVRDAPCNPAMPRSVARWLTELCSDRGDDKGHTKAEAAHLPSRPALASSAAHFFSLTFRPGRGAALFRLRPPRP
jgi:hypothetical protein